MSTMNQAEPEIRQDRLAALEQGGAEGVAALFRRVPSLAESVQDVGPLVQPWARPTDNWTLRRFATYLASPQGTQLLVTHTDRIQYQLLALALWHGGGVDRDQAVAESGAEPEQLDEAVDGLAKLLLINRDRGWLVPRPGVLDYITPPGRLIRPGLDRVVSSDIGIMLQNLGVNAGTRKAERVDALEAALRDPEVLVSVVGSLNEASRRMLDRLIAAGQLDLIELYDDDLDYQAGYERYRIRQESLSTLQSFGLIGIDQYEDVAWVWFDVVVALSGGLFGSWDRVELETVPAIDHHLLPRVPEAVGLLGRVLAYLSANPAPALQNGALGVKSVRAVARALDLPGPTVGLLMALAIELGLVGQSSLGASGRGRNRREVLEWRPAGAAEKWATTPPTERWQHLVEAWLSTVHIPLGDKPVERYDFSRPFLSHALVAGLLIRHLGEIPSGRASDRSTLARWIAFRYQSLVDFDSAAQMIAQATILGLVDDGDQVAPTGLTRHLLAGDDLSEVVAGGAEGFVIQADHTVIAPPDLDAEVALQLGVVASLESHGGARLYRIDDRSLLSAFDTGLDADEVVGFLAAHSTVGVPDVVERAIRDAFGRYGRLRVGSATTWVACDDPAALSAAVAVRGAKLTAVSPTAAVSDQPRAKVMAALRSGGVAAVDVVAGGEAAGDVEVRPLWFVANTRRKAELATDNLGLAGRLIEGRIVSKAPAMLVPAGIEHLAYSDMGMDVEEGW